MQAYIGASMLSSGSSSFKNTRMTIYFAGCDFKCPYCNKADLVSFKEEFLNDINLIKNEIKQNSKFAKEVLFSGGEPCLQRDSLINLLEYSKSLNLKTGIHTNGSKPNIIKELIEKNLIDFIVFDIKSPFNEKVFEKITKCNSFFINGEKILDNIKESINILRKYQDKIEVEFRTTIVPLLVSKKDDILDIARVINDIESKWVLQQFKPDSNILDSNLRNIDRPSSGFMDNLRNFCLKTYPHMEIEVA